MGYISAVLLIAISLRQTVKPIRKTMLPVAVLGGFILLIVKAIGLIDLDENLRKACDSQAQMQEAIAKGLPKTKISGIPFRMEMSAFARHEGSIPLIGDIGEVWPILALGVADALGIELDFMSYKQETPEGKSMREWIVDNVKPLCIEKIRAKAKEYLL